MLPPAPVTHVLRQTVRYSYPSPVTDLRQRLVVVPPSVHGGQRRLGYGIEVRGATGATSVTRLDRFGNTVVDVAACGVDDHVDFVVEARTTTVATVAVAEVHGGRWLTSTRLTSAVGPVAELVTTAAHRAADAGGICALVHAALPYRSGVTGVLTTAAEALAGGAGVCQDLAHLMVAVCRSVGLPARYVSGHLAGEGPSHAWVEALIPEPGPHGTRFRVEAWDPTHDRRTDHRYLTVACGRDYADVAPLSGTFEPTGRSRRC